MILFPRAVYFVLGMAIVALALAACGSRQSLPQIATPEAHTAAVAQATPGLRTVTFPLNVGVPIDEIVVGRDGTVYAAASGATEIVVISPAGSVSTHASPQQGSGYASNVTFTNFSIGRDGDAWFAGTAVNSFLGLSNIPPYPASPWAFVDKISPDGTITDVVDLPGGSFTTPPFTTAESLVLGPLDRPWLMLTKTDLAYPANARPFVTCLEPRLTLCDHTSWVVGPFLPVTGIPPSEGGYASPLVAGPDNAVWDVNLALGHNYIMRVDANGSRSLIRVPDGFQSSINEYSRMTFGPDHAFWFTEGGTQVGRMTLDRRFSFYALPGSTQNVGNSMPIVTGSDGNLWTTSGAQGCTLVRMTPQGVVTLSQPVPGPSNCGVSMAAGNGTLWIGGFNAVTEVFLPSSGT
jgi:hypothetical protein